MPTDPLDALPPSTHRGANATQQLSHADLAFSCTILLGIAATLAVYVYFPAITAVLLISAVIAYALVPLADRLEREGLNRTLGVLLTALGGAGLLVLLGFMLAPAVSEQLQSLPDALMRMGDRLNAFWMKLHAWLPAIVGNVVDGAISSLRRSLDGANLTGGGRLARYASTAATGVTAVAGGLVLVPVFVLLMLRGYHHFLGGAMGLVPFRWRARFQQRTHEVDLALSGFIRGQLTVSAILVVMYAIAFSIIGVPLAILLAIVAGFGELIPYVGNAVALTFGSLLAYASGSFVDVLWVLGAYAVIQSLQSAVISPYIMGRRVSLSPVTIIVALAIFGQALGVMGMLLAVPMAALFKIAARSGLSAWRLSAFYRRGLPA